jgi:dTDP-4-amino-4,6-dideoxygalactose transaminase
VTIPYIDLPSQHRGLRADLVEAFGRVLDHGQFILGPEVALLEERLRERLGVPHVVTVANGTDALVLALRLRGVGPGDEVITVSHSFVATATAIRLAGATPVFVDVDEESMLLDPSGLEGALSPRTRAVLPVHLNGFVCDLDPIARFCERNGLSLVEDCAQAFGARAAGRSVGSTGVGAFSLHPLKGLSALGDGGFLTVASDDDAQRLRRLRNLGLRDRDHCEVVSGNSRLDTLQAAFLLVKLDRFEAWAAARREHAAAYRRALAGVVRLPPEKEGVEPAVSAFVVRHPRRDVLLRRMRERGVDAKVHYPLAIHQQEAFADLPPRPLPVTERVVREILSLPATPELSAEERSRVIESVLDACRDLAP